MSEDGGDGGFMMMFVTLSLILLAFFILLNSMAVIDDKKQRDALGSLLGSFGMLPGSHGLKKESNEVLKQKSIVKQHGMFQLFEDTEKKIDELLAILEAGPHDLEVTYEETTGELKIIIADKLAFPAGTAAISPKLFPFINGIAADARQLNANVSVIGHTDDRPPKGSKTGNWELSIMRGTTVARHLESAGRFRPGKVSSGGAAHWVPRKPNTSLENRASNRRVEILVTTRD